MDKKLKVGEVVWAKIRGFPWWPGMISKIEENYLQGQETKIIVNFIGDSTHAEVSISKIEKFEKKLEEFSKTKKRNLLNSINLAKKIIKGEITFNNHLNIQNNLIKRKMKNKIIQEDESDSDIENEIKEDENNFLKNKRERIRPEDNTKNNQRKNFKHGNNNDKLDNEIEEMKDKNEEERLEEKIKELLFYKIELPSSTSNKLIVNKLDEIHFLIESLPSDKLYKLIFDLTNFLVCLTNNRNHNISSKAESLSNLIRKKIFDDIFNTNNNKINQDMNNIIAFSTSLHDDLTNLLSKIETNTNNLEKEKIKLFSFKQKPTVIYKKRNIRDSILKENNNSHLNLEESNSLSELSINSDKTDCDDKKIEHKKKITLNPLTTQQIYLILSEYFYKMDNENEFYQFLIRGDYFSTRKFSVAIKCHYMRRRVCYKLFRVFNKLLKNIQIDSNTIKSLSIYLETVARDCDSEMGDKYKIFISSIFNKIKENLIISNVPSMILNVLQI